MYKVFDKNPIYWIYADGRVWSAPRGNRRGKFLKMDNSLNYSRVHLTIDGKLKRYYVHRLVAEAFIHNPNDSPQVNHIDGNKLNNHVSNLEWVTQQENNIHAFKTGLIPKILYDDDIRFIWNNYIPHHPEYGGKALALRFGVARVTIYKKLQQYKNGRVL